MGINHETTHCVLYTSVFYFLFLLSKYSLQQFCLKQLLSSFRIREKIRKSDSEVPAHTHTHTHTHTHVRGATWLTWRVSRDCMIFATIFLQPNVLCCNVKFIISFSFVLLEVHRDSVNHGPIDKTILIVMKELIRTGYFSVSLVQSPHSYFKYCLISFSLIYLLLHTLFLTSKCNY
jgi:hypothetical protein